MSLSAPDSCGMLGMLNQGALVGRALMRTRLNKLVVAAAVIAAPVVGLASPAAATTSVGCGSTVSGHPTLKHDLHCHGDGVTLLGGTLNLNHHTITGDGTGNGIVVAGAKATIKNGNIAKFGTGVTATVDDAVVTLDHVTISRITGTAVDGTTINKANLSHVSLRDNKGDALVVIAPNEASVSAIALPRFPTNADDVNVDPSHSNRSAPVSLRETMLWSTETSPSEQYTPTLFESSVESET
jgi:hypothetical protein